MQRDMARCKLILAWIGYVLKVYIEINLFKTLCTLAIITRIYISYRKYKDYVYRKMLVQECLKK